MMALAARRLALSLPTGADDPLLAEAEEICAGQGALCSARRSARRPTGGWPRSSTFPAAAALSARSGSHAASTSTGRHGRTRTTGSRERAGMSLGLGVLGCGSVFAGPYRGMIERLRAAGRVHVSAVYDVDDREAPRRGGAVRRRARPARPRRRSSADDDVDVVLVLTSMNEHGPLAKAALEAGKHVLVEKPMATSLEEAAELLELARRVPGFLVCAPHILLSPTFRAVHARGARRAGRRAPHAPAPGTAGPGPMVERVVLRAGRRLAVRPRRLQRHQPVRAVRAGAAGDGDGRRGDPRARGGRPPDPRRGRRQRARAARLRRRALRRR